jgi:uncharacterized membrane-anchored protein YhcB (DUF1043 family)
VIWLTTFGALAVGIILGLVIATRLNVSPSKIKGLESEIRKLKDSHSEYRDSVSDHFGMTAELVQHMTESYRDVYQHLASGAQDLCSGEVASKLLPADSDAVFDTATSSEEPNPIAPPRDYAAKQSPDQKGALSEDFGIDKSAPVNDEEIALPLTR